MQPRLAGEICHGVVVKMSSVLDRHQQGALAITAEAGGEGSGRCCVKLALITGAAIQRRVSKPQRRAEMEGEGQVGASGGVWGALNFRIEEKKKVK